MPGCDARGADERQWPVCEIGTGQLAVWDLQSPRRSSCTAQFCLSEKFRTNPFQANVNIAEDLFGHHSKLEQKPPSLAPTYKTSEEVFT